jgi:hypothetical protein
LNNDKEQTAFAQSHVDRRAGGKPVAGVPSESSNLQIPDWQREFDTALRGNGRANRSERLQAAKAAIFLRLKSKAARPPGTLERIALNDAIQSLRILKNESLPYTDWDDS